MVGVVRAPALVEGNVGLSSKLSQFDPSQQIHKELSLAPDTQ